MISYDINRVSESSATESSLYQCISCDIMLYHVISHGITRYAHLPHVFSTKDLVIDVRPARDGTCVEQQVANLPSEAQGSTHS